MMSFLKRRLKRLLHILRRLIHLTLVPTAFFVLEVTYWLLPTTLGFTTVVFAYWIAPRRVADFVARVFGPVSIRVSKKRSFDNFTWLARNIFPISTGIALYQLGFYHHAINWLIKLPPEKFNDTGLLLANSLFLCERFDDALMVLHDCRSAQGAGDHAYYHLEGLLYLLRGDVPVATRNLGTAALLYINHNHPHQNMAARYSGHYVITGTDLAAGTNRYLFDAYNYLGQRVVHVGSGCLAAGLYKKAFEIQDKLCQEGVPISDELRIFLAEIDVSVDKFKILPWEWVTQVGHLGMLDILMRMRELGWWAGDAIVLAPVSHVANWPLLSLFEKSCKILVVGVSIPKNLASELLSLQRWLGFSFNAWRFPDDTIVPWQDAGALAMQVWEKEEMGAPLKCLFYERFPMNRFPHDQKFLQFKEYYGIKPGDWYVCLHMRDAGYYGEVSGWGQTHRNSTCDSYIKAIEYIIGQGGWVVQLGGGAAPRLPKLPQIIPYCRSKFKSPLMDLMLMANAKYFVGTTSGLTNIAISFDIPCALVNAITTDAQLWHSKVRFALKRITLDSGRLITQSELTSAPWRWRVFDAGVLNRYNARIEDNEADEILETVKEVAGLADGRQEGQTGKDSENDEWHEQWRSVLAIGHHYGAAKPSRYCVEKWNSFYLK